VASIQTDQSTTRGVLCTHCGDSCNEIDIQYNEGHFCCEGCKTVYILLNEKGLEGYYSIEDLPGISFKNRRQKAYDFLDDDAIIAALVDVKMEKISKLTFTIPSIHCSSCIWLLENLHQLHEGVMASRVNFLKKKVSIQYDHNQISLRQLVELLNSIGYDPDLSLINLEKPEDTGYDKKLLYKIGVAAFCFGNIMLLSFPDYLGIVDTFFHRFVSVFMLVLSLPVLLYSGNDYLISAWKSLKIKQLSIDVPVALGMLTLFLRSAYEIISSTGAGYMDSFTGFVFFLLVGKWFQNYTHESLSFDRNYKSYFPISSWIRQGEEWIVRTIDKIKPRDEILIKNHEIIPCDGILMEGQGRIDYSFVTGESDLVRVDTGEKVFAGGKQNGSSLVIQVSKKIDQSYLTELWNNSIFEKNEESHASALINGISKYFTITIVGIALITLAYWYFTDPTKAFNAFTAVLIIACPCVLALSIPFLYGNAVRILGHLGIYMKNVNVLEKLQDVDFIIFDKTGTVTDNARRKVEWNGAPLSFRHKQLIKSLSLHSSHPLSQTISSFLDVPHVDVIGYEEKEGQGLIGKISETVIRLGSSEFILGTPSSSSQQEVVVEINRKVIGHFTFRNELRSGVESVMNQLRESFTLHLLSGDNDGEAESMTQLFGSRSDLYFNQSPQDKLDHVQSIQKTGKKVMMIGDGLNDAGALKQSDVGLVLADDVNNFTPASDVILDAKYFDRLSSLFIYSSYIKYALYGGFFLAAMYNTIGLFFAVTAQLSPIVAAILMPVSSISIILYGVGMSKLMEKMVFKVAKDNSK